jgi:hypothetical protein
LFFVCRVAIFFFDFVVGLYFDHFLIGFSSTSLQKHTSQGMNLHKIFVSGVPGGPAVGRCLAFWCFFEKKLISRGCENN